MHHGHFRTYDEPARPHHGQPVGGRSHPDQLRRTSTELLHFSTDDLDRDHDALVNTLQLQVGLESHQRYPDGADTIESDDGVLDPDEIHQHYSCLDLAQRPGLSHSELARGAFVTRQSMNVLLQTLERDG